MHTEVEKMKIKKEMLILDHQFKTEREKQKHDNIMLELELMGKCSISSFSRTRFEDNKSKERLRNDQIKVK